MQLKLRKKNIVRSEKERHKEKMKNKTDGCSNTLKIIKKIYVIYNSQLIELTVK